MWTYKETLEIGIDISGKHVVRVLLQNDAAEEQSVFLQFSDYPSEENIQNEANNICTALNG